MTSIYVYCVRTVCSEYKWTAPCDGVELAVLIMRLLVNHAEHHSKNKQTTLCSYDKTKTKWKEKHKKLKRKSLKPNTSAPEGVRFPPMTQFLQFLLWNAFHSCWRMTLQEGTMMHCSRLLLGDSKDQGIHGLERKAKQCFKSLNFREAALCRKLIVSVCTKTRNTGVRLRVRAVLDTCRLSQGILSPICVGSCQKY